MAQTLVHTDFHFPHQERVYHGKVRDVYFLSGDKVAMIATDRISAFDVILPKGTIRSPRTSSKLHEISYPTG